MNAANKVIVRYLLAYFIREHLLLPPIGHFFALLFPQYPCFLQNFLWRPDENGLRELNTTVEARRQNYRKGD